MNTSEHLEGHRNKHSRYLKRLMITLLPLLDNFKPLQNQDSKVLCRDILNKFKQKYSQVTHWINNLEVSNNIHEPTPSKRGVYLDGLYQMLKKKQLQGINSSTRQNLLMAFRSGDHHRILKQVNHHSSQLNDFWEQCSNGTSRICAVPDIYSDLYNFFSSPDVQHEVETRTLYESHFTGDYSGLPISIRIFSNQTPEKESETISNKKLNLLIRSGLMVSLFDQLPGHAKVQVSLWLTQKKKRLYWPSDGYLGIMNVNSGCTIRDINSYPFGRVLIWREEECEKVLVHELIHALGFDCPHNDRKLDQLVYQMFDVSGDNYINLFECYTESWTVIFSSCIYSLMSGVSSSDEVMSLIYLETLFSIYQAAKLLAYFGYEEVSNCHLFCKSRFTGSRQRKGKFNQGSSLLSYYLFKSAILFSLDKFAKFCHQHNPNNTPWKFLAEQKAFWDLILECFSDSKYLQHLDRCITFFKNQKSSSDNTYGLCTLRMTINEFN